MIIGTFNDQNLFYVRTEQRSDESFDIVAIGSQDGAQAILQGLTRFIQLEEQLIIDEEALDKARELS